MLRFIAGRVSLFHFEQAKTQANKTINSRKVGIK